LIRLAGRREPVPEERANRVKAAVRDHWQAEIRRRSRARFRRTALILATAATIVIAVMVGVRQIGPDGTADATMMVESLTGPAWMQEAALSTGTEIPAGSSVETGDGGRLAVRLQSGHSVRLDSGSLLTMVETGVLHLERGAVYVDSGTGGLDPEPVLVRTAVGSILETGTQFEVRLLDGSLRIRVREGSVTLTDDRGEHAVETAVELVRLSDGTVARRQIELHGPDWDWIAGITPMIDFQGRTADAFLGWVARERGWTLTYADLEVARAAAETELGGSVGEIGIDQALDAVLPACRLAYRLEGGTLLIENMPE
jgi:ferric-dicitrate binding protein FerR (iron transport regulator)